MPQNNTQQFLGSVVDFFSLNQSIVLEGMLETSVHWWCCGFENKQEGMEAMKVWSELK